MKILAIFNNNYSITENFELKKTIAFLRKAHFQQPSPSWTIGFDKTLFDDTKIEPS